MRKSLLKSLVGVAVLGATMAITSVAAMAATYTYNPSTSTTKVNAGGAVTEGIFTITDATAKKFSIDGNSKTSPIDGTDFTKRLKTGGKAGSVTIALPESGLIIVEGMSSSSSDSRTVSLAGKDFTVDGKYLNSFCVKDLSAGSYDITFSGGFNIYRITALTGNDAVVPTIASTKASKYGDEICVDVVNGDTYIIHSVSESDLKSINSLTLARFDGTALSATTTDTVYNKVEFSDGSAVEAANGSYIYAVKLEGTCARQPYSTKTGEKDDAGNEISKSYSWITE